MPFLPIDLARRTLAALPPETAHRLTLAALARGIGVPRPRPHDPRLARTVLGLAFPTPIGLAAGFDKDARATPSYASVGFGFAEIGTVTPRPQAGNPRPRLFRLAADGAVVNRMGFNNEGLGRCLERLARQRRSGRIAIPLGVNVGINKEGADPLADYPAMVRAVAPHADYVAINVSSPNTPGLRDLQQEDRLGAILDAVRAGMPEGTRLLVKLAPDLADAALPGLVRVIAGSGCCAGVIVTNTTIARPAGLVGRAAAEAGGLSGRPLAPRAREVLALVAAARDAIARAAGPRLAIIACGGIATGRDVAQRLASGADLVQLYTSFAYQGPALLARLEAEMLEIGPAPGPASPGEAAGDRTPATV